jgi:hypothetical protein
MRRHCVLAVVVVALLPGCKGMGGFASGLGKVAAGAATGLAKAAPVVAKGVAKAAPVIAKGVARAAPVVVHGVAHAAPRALRVAGAIAEASVTSPSFTVVVPATPTSLPPDPCYACPLDDCEACAGYAGYACLVSPPGAPARCESSAPPDAAPASELSELDDAPSAELPADAR